MRKYGASLGGTSTELKNRCVIIQKLCDMSLEWTMSLKTDYCRKFCAMLNAVETNKVEIMENFAECMIDPSLKFDHQLRTAMRNDFAEEEWLQ